MMTPTPHGFTWLQRSDLRQQVLLRLVQPLTIHQLVHQSGLTADACGVALHGLNRRGWVRCLNPAQVRSRLHGLTPLGQIYQAWLRQQRGMNEPVPRLPVIDWQRYGSLCYRHRSIVLRTLDQPLQPAAIKRRAYGRDPSIRMSANNVRDVIRLFLDWGIAERVESDRGGYPRYQLTPVGRIYQQLNLQAYDSTAYLLPRRWDHDP